MSCRYKGGAGRAGGRVCAGVVVVVAVQEVRGEELAAGRCEEEGGCCWKILRKILKKSLFVCFYLPVVVVVSL